MNLQNMRVILLLLLILICTMMPSVYAADEFFPLNNLKEGMVADGYTVFEGTEIQTFKAKVLKVLPEGKGPGKFILVRLSGEKIELNGGIASGMSGSPLYIRGKLLGAIGYGFENADPYLAVVTPIESMLSLMNEAQQLPAKLSFDDEVYGHLEAIPVSTPLLVNGLTAGGFNHLEQNSTNFDLKPLLVASDSVDSKKISSTALKPGAALALSLVTGDVNVVALGTMTYIKNDYFIAFGHQFSGRGRVDYPAAAAEIYTTVVSKNMSFRMGSALQPIGSVLIDRKNGISGKLNQKSPMIEVVAETTDLDSNQNQISSFSVVKDARLYPNLIAAGCVSSLEKALNRTGAGTAEVELEIVCSDRRIEHKNVFFGTDIAKNAVRDIEQLLDILAKNEFSTVDISAVKFKAKITENVNAARIINMEVDKNKVEAGATFDVIATLRRYRGNTAKVTFKVKVPENCRVGELQFTLKSLSDIVEKRDTLNENKIYYSLDEEINEYLKDNKNNQLLLECNMEMKSGNRQEKRYYTDFDCWVQGQATVAVEVQ